MDLKIGLAVITALSSISVIWGKSTEITGSTTAMIYLAKYGHIDPKVLNPSSGSLISQDTIRDSIMSFQSMAGIDQTGELDDKTIEMMNTPRCGVKDKVGFGSYARRKKRYALQGSRWRVKDLTYRITKYPTLLLKSEVDREIRAAFKVWEAVTDLTFTPSTKSKVHIEIRFERGEHGDGDPFDGAGGTLAHAYYPIYGGDAHFDGDENWTINVNRGTNLYIVSAHEFGHSLGLSHSDIKTALMAPFYRGYDPNFKLDSDDIKAIQALYGERQNKPAPLPQVPTNTESSTLCSDGTFDAIVTMEDKETYVFKGDSFWKLTDNGVASGYPKKVSSWGLPSNLDAAFTWSNGKTFFFKGDKYYRFSDMTLDEGYPRDISKGFAGIPSNIDTAFVWSGNGKIYFFKGSKYWRFDPVNTTPVKSQYPKEIKNWEGIPNDIDGALQYVNGYTYFFKKGKYWRFNDRSFKVDAAEPAFPREAGYWWFGCPASSSALQNAGVQQDLSSVPLNEEDAGGDTFDADEGGPKFGPSISSYYYSSSDQVSVSMLSTLAMVVLAHILRY